MNEWVWYNRKYSWSLFPVLGAELQNPGNFLRQGHLSFARTFSDQACGYANRRLLGPWFQRGTEKGA